MFAVQDLFLPATFTFSKISFEASFTPFGKLYKMYYLGIDDFS